MAGAQRADCRRRGASVRTPLTSAAFANSSDTARSPQHAAHPLFRARVRCTGLANHFNSYRSLRLRSGQGALARQRQLLAVLHSSIGLDVHLPALHRLGGLFWPPHSRIMDRLAIASECRAQALHCHMVADIVTDQQVRALWASMGQMWTKLAERAERLQAHQGRWNAHAYSPEINRSRAWKPMRPCVPSARRK
jgi:hypothetical protein